MKKLRPAAFLTAGLLLLSGCASKDSSSSDNTMENTASTNSPSPEKAPETTASAPAKYKTGTFTTYELPDFRFTISDDFVDELASIELADPLLARNFKNDLFEYLTIGNVHPLYVDISYYGNNEFEQIKAWDNVSDVSYELIDLDGFQAASINYITSRSGEKPMGYSYYTAVCEGNMFRIAAGYPAENKDKAVPMLNDIIHSLVYTSDYRLPTGQQEYENELYSISFGSEWVRNANYSDEGLKYHGLECSDVFNFAKAASYAEEHCVVAIQAENAPEGYSVSDEADKLKNDTLEQYSFYDSAERSQTDILGKNAETVSFRTELGDDTSTTTYHLFDHGGKLFRIEIMYRNDDQQEEILRKVNELINNIKLK